MKARGKKIKNITDFWADVKNNKCKCGKPEVVHGYCQECWDNGGREKVLATAQEELALLHGQQDKANRLYEKRVGCA